MVWFKYRAALQVQSSLNTKIYNLYDVPNVNIQASLNYVSVSISLSTPPLSKYPAPFSAYPAPFSSLEETLTDRPDMIIAVYRRC